MLRTALFCRKQMQEQAVITIHIKIQEGFLPLFPAGQFFNFSVYCIILLRFPASLQLNHELFRRMQRPSFPFRGFSRFPALISLCQKQPSAVSFFTDLMQINISLVSFPIHD